MMWAKISEKFRNSPKRLEVAQALIRHGFQVEAPGIISCKSIRIPLKSIGDALGIDRRTIRATTEDICEDKLLFSFFSKLLPAGPSLEKVAKEMGYGVITIYVAAPENPGILSEVTSTIAGYGIAIRQVLAEDVAIFREPCLKVLTQGSLPGRAIETLASIEGVNRVIIEK